MSNIYTRCENIKSNVNKLHSMSPESIRSIVDSLEEKRLKLLNYWTQPDPIAEEQIRTLTFTINILNNKK